MLQLSGSWKIQEACSKPGHSCTRKATAAHCMQGRQVVLREDVCQSCSLNCIQGGKIGAESTQALQYCLPRLRRFTLLQRQQARHCFPCMTLAWCSTVAPEEIHEPHYTAISKNTSFCPPILFRSSKFRLASRSQRTTLHHPYPVALIMMIY